MTVRRQAVNIALATMAALALLSSPSWADMTKDQCIDANAKAQDLRRDHRLSAAREQLRLCADPSCPTLVRTDCIKRLDELESVQPTIAFEVKDASGADVTTVKVTVDGKPVPDRLNATALPLDPGQHTATFEAEGLTSVTRSLVLTEGDRGRRESVVLVAATPVATATANGGSMSTQKVLGVVAGGVGVVGVVVGSVFGVMTLFKKSQLESDCPGSSCTAEGHTKAESDHSAGITDSTVSTVGFIAGAALIAGGAAVFFTARSSEKPAGAALTILPSIGPGGGGLSLRAQF
jgi:hypothetical protein